MHDIFLTIIPFFIIIGIGFVMKPFIDSEKWIEVLNKYGLYIGFPAIIVSSLVGVKDKVDLDFWAVYANLLILLFAITAVFLITGFLKLDRETRNTYVICTFFGNVAYLGFPFVSSLSPDSATLISLLISVYIFIVFTVGIVILDLSRNSHELNLPLLLGNLLKNPLLLAVFVGFALIAFDIALPTVLLKPIDVLASSGVPIVLLSLGIFMYRRIAFDRKLLHAATISVCKLLVLPLLFFLLLPLFHLPEREVSVSIIEAAMPLAITPFALAEIYPLDKEIIAMTVIISTLLSLVSLVLISSLVM